MTIASTTVRHGTLILSSVCAMLALSGCRLDETGAEGPKVSSQTAAVCMESCTAVAHFDEPCSDLPHPISVLDSVCKVMKSSWYAKCADLGPQGSRVDCCAACPKPPVNGPTGCGTTGDPEPSGCDAILCNTVCKSKGCAIGTCDGAQRCSCGPTLNAPPSGDGSSSSSGGGESSSGSPPGGGGLTIGGSGSGPCSQGMTVTPVQCLQLCGGIADTFAGICWI